MALLSVRTATTTWLGREAELDALTEVLLRRPAAVLVEGEPGIGKTRLVRELVRRLPASRVLEGTCAPVAEPFRYGPVLEALRTIGKPIGPLSPVAGALRPLLPELSEILPPGTGQAGRHLEFRAIRELLDACGSALLVLDDLHRADEHTHDLLRFLLSKPPARLGIVLVAERPHTLSFRPPPGVRSARLEPGPLDAADLRRLAVSSLGVPRVSGEFAAELHELTAGIPFAVEEVLSTLRPQGPLTRKALRDLKVPATLREAISERVNALPDGARRVTHAAAILGEQAEARLIGAVCGLRGDRLYATIDQALRGGVLRETGLNQYGFRYPLARKAVLHTIGGPQRQRLHNRALRVLAEMRPPPLIRLAGHARSAGDTELWHSFAEQAADEAIAAGRTGQAIEVLSDLLDNGEFPGEDLIRLATKLSRVAARGFSQSAAATLRRIVDSGSLPRTTRGTIRLDLGVLLVRTAGQLGRGRQELARAIDELADRPELMARGIDILALPVDGLSPLSWHEAWMAKARAVFDRVRDPELRLILTADRITTRVYLGDDSVWPEFDRLPRSSPNPAEQAQLARLRCNLADALAWLGRLEEARRLLDDGLRMADELGTFVVQGLGRSTRLRIDWAGGAWSDLTESTESLRERYPDLGSVIPESALVLASLAMARGEFGEAERLLPETGVHDPEHGSMPIVLAAAAQLVRLRLSTQDIDGACAAADEGMAAARRKGIWVWAGDLASAAVEAYLLGGREDDAKAVVADLTHGIADRNAPAADAALTLGKALLTGDAATFDEAHKKYADLPMPYPATLAAERAALARLADGDRKALDELSRVAECYQRLGATRDAGRCRHALREHGAWVPSGRGRRGYGRELSPREREVARMLAEGRTNREIAAGLFLSPRTVEQHVSNVLRKLGARSRTEVARLTS